MATVSHILITESALDAILMGDGMSDASVVPLQSERVLRVELSAQIDGYRVASEPESPLLALIGIEWLEILKCDGGRTSEIYRRIARVIKGLKSPPIHLPRQWLEYHFRNLLTFFALSKDVSSFRWVVEIDFGARVTRFDLLTSAEDEIELSAFNPSPWPPNFDEMVARLKTASVPESNKEFHGPLAEKFDLQSIGSGSVVENRTAEEWTPLLSPSQNAIILKEINSSIRIVGPAGSGKTLVLCLRAIQISKDSNVIAEGRRILIATHSWAMAERIDGILFTLNGSASPTQITVFPLLSLLEMYAGQIGDKRTNIIGGDSSEGRLKSLDIIRDIVQSRAEKAVGLSDWIDSALGAGTESKTRFDLVLNLYEEISGVMTASGVSPDDQESIQTYLNAAREDWMPPFDSVEDSRFVVSVFRAFMQELVDRSAITTDQFVLDSIRVLETFAWRMRKETEGYDFIFVDELQLFDPQERAALELLGRDRRGVPFITAEDPAQGIFSTLNSRSSKVDNTPLYLDVVHRFNQQIFQFISYIYQKFPLNALPLRIHENKAIGKQGPTIAVISDEKLAVAKAVELVREAQTISGAEGRVCVATLGDIDAEIADMLTAQGLKVVRLQSFDDVERLAYSKKAVVVAPWQFVGGTQFSHVVVLAAGLTPPSSQFGRLREMVSVYLSCSRATESLDIVCSGYVPAVLANATDDGFLISV